TIRPPYDTMFKPEDMPVPSTFSQEDLPRWAKAARRNGPYALNKPRREELLREHKAGYCGEVKCIDDNVGRILDCLAEQGILDKTIVVFTTDHGDYMGEYGLRGKNQLYETAYRSPLLIRWPKKIPKGTVIDNIVSTVDFQPTILRLMGIEPSGREQGRDASALLQGKKLDWQDVAFIHHSSLNRSGIFTAQYELAYVKDNDHILFDRMNDPEQVNNLFNEPKYKKAIDELTDQIIRHHVEVNSSAVSWLKEIKSIGL
ncbi:MAG: sulfatase/phosphatase domain-containing protein, partial [Candidatus Zixiibacteriota bacterium]